MRKNNQSIARKSRLNISLGVALVALLVFLAWRPENADPSYVDSIDTRPSRAAGEDSKMAEIIANDLSKVSDESVSIFYEKHPLLFARRSRYDLDLIVGGAVTMEQSIGARGLAKHGIKNHKQPKEVMDLLMDFWLRNDLQPKRFVGSLPAEKLPRALLEDLDAATIGQVNVFSGTVSTLNSSMAYVVSARTSAPVSLTDAAPQIRRFIIEEGVRASKSRNSNLRSVAAAALLTGGELPWCVSVCIKDEPSMKSHAR